MTAAVAPLANDAYFISSQLTSTFLTLDSGTEGTNITAWRYDGGPHQQWAVTSNGQQYFIQNKLYGTYISFGAGTFTFASLTRQPWLIQEYKSGYIVGSDHSNFVFNLDGSVPNIFGDAVPLLVFPFYIQIGPDNQVWYFNSTTTSAAATTTRTAVSTTNAAVTTASPTVSACPVDRNATPAIVGGVVAGFLLLVICIVVAFWMGKRRTSTASASPPDHPNARPSLPTAPAQIAFHSPLMATSMPVAPRPEAPMMISAPAARPEHPLGPPAQAESTYPQFYAPPASPAPEYSVSPPFPTSTLKTSLTSATYT